MPIKNTEFANFFSPYGRYTIDYRGNNLGEIITPMQFSILPVEVPIAYANGTTGKATIDYNYTIDCEINKVFPSVLELLSGREIVAPQKKQDVLRFSKNTERDYTLNTYDSYVENSGALEIHNIDTYGEDDTADVGRTMFFYNAMPTVSNISALYKIETLTITVSFFCSKWKLRNGKIKGDWVTGGIGNANTMYDTPTGKERIEGEYIG